MQVKIDKTFQVKAPVDAAWALLSSPNDVVTCVPGAKIVEQIDESNYKGAVSMKIGPVVTDFRGDIEIQTLDESGHKMVLKGSGKDARGKGRATMTMTGVLTEVEPNLTDVATRMEVKVQGKLAQFGARLMQDVSNRMFEQFITCFEDSLIQEGEPEGEEPDPSAVEGSEDAVPVTDSPGKTSSEAAPEPIKALPLLFQALMDAIKRLFKRST